MLLYSNFNSIVDTLLAASVMPMALIGGIFALYLMGRHLVFPLPSVLSDCLDLGDGGIIVLTYFNQMLESGLTRPQAILNLVIPVYVR